jgi:hypothetical protein
MERLNENLKMLRNMRERLSAMLARLKSDPELRDSGELMHVTGELIKNLERKSWLSKRRSEEWNGDRNRKGERSAVKGRRLVEIGLKAKAHRGK